MIGHQISESGSGVGSIIINILPMTAKLATAAPRGDGELLASIAVGRMLRLSL